MCSPLDRNYHDCSNQFNASCRKRGRVTLIIDLLELITSLFFNPLGKRFYFTVCLKRYTIQYDIILQVSKVFESKKVITWLDQLMSSSEIEFLVTISIYLLFPFISNTSLRIRHLLYCTLASRVVCLSGCPQIPWRKLREIWTIWSFPLVLCLWYCKRVLLT